MSNRQTSAMLALLLAAGLACWRALPARQPALPPILTVDLNTSSQELLETLPKVGPSLAKRIVSARKKKPLASADDLRARVKGVGPVTQNLLAPYLSKPSGVTENLVSVDPGVTVPASTETPERRSPVD